MSNRVRHELKHFFGISAGWLFADMMLALAMVFLAANTMTPLSPRHIQITPTPTATPTPSARILETNYCQLILEDGDPGRFSRDKNFAIKTLEPQITRIGFIQHRKVGIAIAYGGVDDMTDSAQQKQGTDMAANVYKVLQDLGQKEQGQIIPFKGTSYYEPLFTGYHPSHQVVIDIYLVVSPAYPKGTCNSSHHPM
jgi:hypothetical protein